MNIGELMTEIKSDHHIDTLTELSNILDFCIEKYGAKETQVSFQHLLELAICVVVMDRVDTPEEAAVELRAFSKDFKTFAQYAPELFRAFEKTFG